MTQRRRLPLEPSTTAQRRSQVMSLEGMTQAKWNSLSASERARVQDLSGLRPELLGHEGWRVEVTYKKGEKRRFIVSRSGGWRPCHIELKRIDSSGGMGVYGDIVSVRRIKRVR